MAGAACTLPFGRQCIRSLWLGKFVITHKGQRVVVLDARQTRQMSVGMKTYTRELSARLPAVAPDLRFVAIERGANFGIEEQVRLPWRIRATRPDATHFMSVYAPFFAPRPYLVTIHDLIHLRFPAFFKSKVLPYYRGVVRHVARRAARVITDDERTVDDLKDLLGVQPARVRVIALGVGDIYLREHEPYRAQRPYFLYVGNHRPHKNLGTLFAAWRALAPQVEADLYITGDDDLGISQTAREGGVVRFLGEVSDVKLASLYRGAMALVQPSLCEGFGLPMLEAMAVGCCVIGSRSACPAVLADAALCFSADDAPELTAFMQRVFRDEGLRGRLVNEGRRIAKSLTWERCARATAAVYREVLEEPPC